MKKEINDDEGIFKNIKFRENIFRSYNRLGKKVIGLAKDLNLIGVEISKKQMIKRRKDIQKNFSREYLPTSKSLESIRSLSKGIQKEEIAKINNHLQNKYKILYQNQNRLYSDRLSNLIRKNIKIKQIINNKETDRIFKRNFSSAKNEDNTPWLPKIINTEENRNEKFFISELDVANEEKKNRVLQTIENQHINLRNINNILMNNNINNLSSINSNEDSETIKKGKSLKDIHKFSDVTDKKIKRIKESNLKFKDKIKNVKYLSNVLSWDLKSKMKYAYWKYFVLEPQKHFIDINDYEKNETNELELRKTFYDRVTDVVDNLKKYQKTKDFQQIGKQFGIDLNKGEKIVKQERYISKFRENIQKLEEIEERKIKEKEKDLLIKNFFVQNGISLAEINKYEH